MIVPFQDIAYILEIDNCLSKAILIFFIGNENPNV